MAREAMKYLTIVIMLLGVPCDSSEAQQIDVVLRSDVSSTPQPLPNYWKPSAKVQKGHTHPSAGDAMLPPETEFYDRFFRDMNNNVGDTRIVIDFVRVESGGLDIGPDSRFIDYLRAWREAGGKVVLTILHIPPSLYYNQIEPLACEDPPGDPDNPGPPLCSRFRPSDFEEYGSLLRNLLIYLTAPPGMTTVSDRRLFGDDSPKDTQGFDDLYFLFWHETNTYRYACEEPDPEHPECWTQRGPMWQDDFSQWLKLYEYWVQAVRDVRSNYPVSFKIGTQLFMANNSWHGGYSLIDTDTFINFLLGNLPDDSSGCWEPYIHDPGEFPLDLDFMCRQERTNDHQFLSTEGWDWGDRDRNVCELNLPEINPHSENRGWDWNHFGKFHRNYDPHIPSPGLQWYSLDVRSAAYGVIKDYVLSANSSDPLGRQMYYGAEVDNHMGAINYLAQVWDHFENPNQTAIPPGDFLQSLWAEFWADPGSGSPGLVGGGENWPDHDLDSDSSGWDYGLFKGACGMLYTNSMDVSMYENQEGAVSLKKAYYNIAQMMGKLKSYQLEVDYPMYQVDKDKIRGIVTKGGSDKFAILWWYYVNPEDVASEIGSWNYSDVVNYADSSLHKDVAIVLTNVPFARYDLTRYLLNENYSNSWTYRNEIYEMYLNQGRDEATIDAINEAVLGVNSEISVALEKVEEKENYLIPDANGRIKLRYSDVPPWTAMLILIENNQIDDDEYRCLAAPIRHGEI